MTVAEAGNVAPTRRYQWSLRSFLKIVICVGFGVGWWGRQLMRPVPSDYIRVSGRVLVNGQPFHGANVAFSNRVDAASGRTGAFGEFSIFMLPGKYVVTISKPYDMSRLVVSSPEVDDLPLKEKNREAIPKRYSDLKQTTLTFEVTRDGPNRAVFHLQY